MHMCSHARVRLPANVPDFLLHSVTVRINSMSIHPNTSTRSYTDVHSPRMYCNTGILTHTYTHAHTHVYIHTKTKGHSAQKPMMRAAVVAYKDCMAKPTCVKYEL